MTGTWLRRVARTGAAALAAGWCHAAEPLFADDLAGEIVPWEELTKILAVSRGVAVLPTIAFEFDSDRLTPSSETQLDHLARAMRLPAFARSTFSIEGHTDSVGSAAYNRDLSSRRARRVMRRLVEEHGIPAGMLTARGLGESAPRAELAPEDGRNRRVEIVNTTRRGADAEGDASELRTPELQTPDRPPARNDDAIEIEGDASALQTPELQTPDRPPARSDDAADRAPVKRALLVGIDAYRHVSPLEGPVDDARAMRAFLVERAGYGPADVKLLLDSQATRAGILDSVLEWLVAGTQPGDEAFLFFSGHGYQQLDGADGDEDDGMDETLVPVDASIDENDRVHGMIADDEIATLLDKLTGRRVLVVVDACHSGTTDRGGAGNWRYVKTPRKPDGSPISFVRSRGIRQAVATPFADGRGDVTFWTAVQAHQKALVDREPRAGEAGSVFTRRLLQGARDGMADADGDGRVTTAELHRYVVAESEAYCARYPGDCPRGLTPQLDVTAERMARPALGAPTVESGTAALVKDLIVRPGRGSVEAAADGLKLRLPAGARFETGDEIALLVESDRDGSLVLLDIDAAGNLVQLFPNDFTSSGKTGRIRAGRPLSLPGPGDGFRFLAMPPSGDGLLVAVLSEGGVRLRDVLSRRKDLSVVPRPEAYLADLSEALRVADLDGEGGEAWSVATLRYEITAP